MYFQSLRELRSLFQVGTVPVWELLKSNWNVQRLGNAKTHCLRAKNPKLGEVTWRFSLDFDRDYKEGEPKRELLALSNSQQKKGR